MRVCALLIILFFGSVPASLAVDIRGPYLTRLLSDEATIVFHTQEKADIVLEYHGQGDRSRPVRRKSRQGRSHIFRIKGLQPQTRYTYRIAGSLGMNGSGDVLTPWRSFTTAPKRSTPFTFIVYGDSRGGRRGAARHTAVTGQFLKHAPRFIVSTGDLIIGGQHASSSMFSTDWTENFFRPLDGVIRTVPYYLAVGNHDQDSPDAVRGTLTAFPDLAQSPFYSFRYSNTHFIVLHVANQMKEFQAQKQWFIRELKRARRADWRIVVLHVSPFTNGKYRGRKWTLAGREDFLRTCVRYGADLVLSGHDHSYQRFHPLKSSTRDTHAVQFVVTGLAGTNPYQAVADDFSAKIVNDTDHFCVVHVDDEDITLTAYDAQNRAMDTVSLSKNERVRGKVWQPVPLE